MTDSPGAAVSRRLSALLRAAGGFPRGSVLPPEREGFLATNTALAEESLEPLVAETVEPLVTEAAEDRDVTEDSRVPAGLAREGGFHLLLVASTIEN